MTLKFACYTNAFVELGKVVRRGRSLFFHEDDLAKMGTDLAHVHTLELVDLGEEKPLAPDWGSFDGRR